MKNEALKHDIVLILISSFFIWQAQCLLHH